MLSDVKIIPIVKPSRQVRFRITALFLSFSFLANEKPNVPILLIAFLIIFGKCVGRT